MIFSAWAAIAALSPIWPGGRRLTPVQRGRMWKWMWKTICPPAEFVELLDRDALSAHARDGGLGDLLDPLDQAREHGGVDVHEIAGG